MAVKRNEIVFCGVDFWDRPVFKRNNGQYYCSTEQLVRADEIGDEEIEEILDKINSGMDQLYFKGCEFDGEPDYPVEYNH